MKLKKQKRWELKKNLNGVIVTPLDSKFKWRAFGLVIDGPKVLQRNHPSYEEIIESWFHV